MSSHVWSVSRSELISPLVPSNFLTRRKAHNSPTTESWATAVSWSAGVLATHIYKPWSPKLTLIISSTPSSRTYLRETAKAQIRHALHALIFTSRKEKEWCGGSPRVLAAVEGHAVSLPDNLKVATKGGIKLRLAWKLDGGSSQNPQILWGVYYSGRICEWEWKSAEWFKN